MYYFYTSGVLDDSVVRQIANNQSSKECKRKDCECTVETVQTPHLVLRDQLPPCQSCIQVHYSFRVHGVHESQDVADFMSRHMDEICQPNPCNTETVD